MSLLLLLIRMATRRESRSQESETVSLDGRSLAQAVPVQMGATCDEIDPRADLFFHASNDMTGTPRGEILIMLLRVDAMTSCNCNWRALLTVCACIVKKSRRAQEG